MIKIHHLGVSQSDRVVWLMEELGLGYDLVWYDRGPDNLQPPEYRALHPAATAPLIEDDGRILVESAVILEYICRTYADGRLTVDPAAGNYYDYLYWMHWNNNVQGLFFATLAQAGHTEGEFAPAHQFIAGRQNGLMNYLESTLGESQFVAGDELTCADIMVAFNLTTLPTSAAAAQGMANIERYVAQIVSRPAYIKAMSIAGPQAPRPN